MNQEALNSYVVEAVRAALGEAYLVGGTVRDALMNRPLKGDLDFATPLKPAKVSQVLSKQGFPVDDHAKQFGTIATKIGGHKIEITTFRTEVYEPGSRSPIVSFNTTLETDLGRRDFTINAIAYDGVTYIDPFDGQIDIAEKRIRTTDDPHKTFIDDPLRMLRALRFVSQLDFYIDAETSEAAYYNRELLRSISRERIADEFKKIVEGDHWSKAIAAGFSLQLLDIIFGTENSQLDIAKFIYELESRSDLQLSGYAKRVALLIECLAKTIAESKSADISYETSLRFALLGNLAKSMMLQRFDERAMRDELIQIQHTESLNRLAADYESITDKSSYPANVLQEKMLVIRVREALSAGDISKTSKLAKELLDVQQHMISSFTDANQLEQAIRTKKNYMLSSLEYVLLAEVADMSCIEHAEDLKRVYEKLSKSPSFRLQRVSLSVAEKAGVIERALMRLNQLHPGHYTTLSDAEIMEHNPHIPYDNSRLDDIIAAYREDLKATRHELSGDELLKTKYHLNRKIASLLYKRNKTKSSVYYSYRVEAQKFKTLRTKTVEDFEAAFDDLAKFMDLRIRTIDSVIKVPNIEHGYYLDTAEVLLHLMNLQTDPSDKWHTLAAVLANYRHASEHDGHIPRYRILSTWLKIVMTVRDTVSADRLKALRQMVVSSGVANYVDADEEYFLANYPKLDETRWRVKQVLYVLDILFDDTAAQQRTQPEPVDKTLQAAVLLYRQSLLGADALQSILLQHIQKMYDPQQVVLPLDAQLTGLQHDRSQRLMDLLAQSESKNIEFKSSWRYDVKKKEIDASGGLIDTVLKTIVGYMNCDGGTLLIGVDDSGVPVGLESTDFRLTPKDDPQKMRDKLMRQIDQTLINRIGAVDTQSMNIEFIPYDADRTVCVIDVKRSETKPIFLDGKKFYIRRNGRTDELIGAKLAEFMRDRFYGTKE